MASHYELDNEVKTTMNNVLVVEKRFMSTHRLLGYLKSKHVIENRKTSEIMKDFKKYIEASEDYCLLNNHDTEEGYYTTLLPAFISNGKFACNQSIQHLSPLYNKNLWHELNRQFFIKTLESYGFKKEQAIAVIDQTTCEISPLPIRFCSDSYHLVSEQYLNLEVTPDIINNNMVSLMNIANGKYSIFNHINESSEICEKQMKTKKYKSKEKLMQQKLTKKGALNATNVISNSMEEVSCSQNQANFENNTNELNLSPITQMVRLMCSTENPTQDKDVCTYFESIESKIQLDEKINGCTKKKYFEVVKEVIGYILSETIAKRSYIVHNNIINFICQRNLVTINEIIEYISNHEVCKNEFEFIFRELSEKTIIAYLNLKMGKTILRTNQKWLKVNFIYTKLYDTVLKRDVLTQFIRRIMFHYSDGISEVILYNEVLKSLKDILDKNFDKIEYFLNFAKKNCSLIFVPGDGKIYPVNIARLPEYLHVDLVNNLRKYIDQYHVISFQNVAEIIDPNSEIKNYHEVMQSLPKYISAYCKDFVISDDTMKIIQKNLFWEECSACFSHKNEYPSKVGITTKRKNNERKLSKSNCVYKKTIHEKMETMSTKISETELLNTEQKHQTVKNEVTVLFKDQMEKSNFTHQFDEISEFTISFEDWLNIGHSVRSKLEIHKAFTDNIINCNKKTHGTLFPAAIKNEINNNRKTRMHKLRRSRSLEILKNFNIETPSIEIREKHIKLKPLAKPAISRFDRACGNTVKTKCVTNNPYNIFNEIYSTPDAEKHIKKTRRPITNNVKTANIIPPNKCYANNISYGNNETYFNLNAKKQMQRNQIPAMNDMINTNTEPFNTSSNYKNQTYSYHHSNYFKNTENSNNFSNCHKLNFTHTRQFNEIAEKEPVISSEYWPKTAQSVRPKLRTYETFTSDTVNYNKNMHRIPFLASSKSEMNSSSLETKMNFEYMSDRVKSLEFYDSINTGTNTTEAHRKHINPEQRPRSKTSRFDRSYYKIHPNSVKTKSNTNNPYNIFDENYFNLNAEKQIGETNAENQIPILSEVKTTDTILPEKYFQSNLHNSNKEIYFDPSADKYVQRPTMSDAKSKTAVPNVALYCKNQDFFPKPNPKPNDNKIYCNTAFSFDDRKADVNQRDLIQPKITVCDNISSPNSGKERIMPKKWSPAYKFYSENKNDASDANDEKPIIQPQLTIRHIYDKYIRDQFVRDNQHMTSVNQNNDTPSYDTSNMAEFINDDHIKSQPQRHPRMTIDEFSYRSLVHYANLMANVVKEEKEESNKYPLGTHDKRSESKSDKTNDENPNEVKKDYSQRMNDLLQAFVLHDLSDNSNVSTNF